VERAAFLAALGASPALLAAAPLSPPTDPTRRTGSALVLSGGGARGAYEAGVIEGLRRAANVADGRPIPGIEVVCGTSIGSVNGWFVATAQYSALAALWSGIAAEDVFRIKRKFAATTKPGAFVVDRIIGAVALARGLTQDEQGILQGERVERWLAKHVDPRTPLVMPYVFTVTNLDRERAEIFYRLPFDVTPADSSSALARIRSSVGYETVIHPANDDVLRPAIRASAALPVLFDPVVLALGTESSDRYVDGGIADNSPIDVARALALSVYTVLVDAVHPERRPYESALSIGVGAFGVAQQRILEASLRAAYLETRGKRLFAGNAMDAEQRAFMARILDADLFMVRPAVDFDLDFVEFDRQTKIDAAYAAGVRDIASGWKPYAFAANPAAA
jgi:predicted acylesterase/phospholipase RssA